MQSVPFCVDERANDHEHSVDESNDELALWAGMGHVSPDVSSEPTVTTTPRVMSVTRIDGDQRGERVARTLTARWSRVVSPPMYFQMFQQMKKQLGQLDKWLEIATAFADAKKIDSSTMIGLRLAADQFPFARQVQISCDTVKLGASRLTGRDAPSHADDEATLAQLRDRVKATITYLDGFSEKDFATASTRSITQPRWEGRTMTGNDYFFEHIVPNFFFHLTTSYAILRHNGVGIGKRDYLGTLTQTAPKA